MVNLKFSKKEIVKIRKLKISKKKPSSLVRTTERKIQDKFEMVAICRRSNVLKFLSNCVPS